MLMAGVFEKYRVVHQIHLGKFEIDLPKDAIIEFDGQIAKYAGKEYAEPAILGALKARWVVPAVDTSSKFTPQSAGVQVRPAQTAGQERGEAMKVDAASAEEEVVGTLAATNARRSAGSTPEPKEAAPKAAPAPEAPKAAAKNRPPPKTAAASVTPPPKAGEASVTSPPKAGAVTTTKSEAVPTEIDYQLPAAPAQSSEGVAVARIGKPPVQKTVLTDARQVSAEISKMESGGPIKTQKFAVVKSEEDQAAADADQKPFRGPVARVKANDAPENAEHISKVAKNGATGDVSEARSGGEDLSELLPDAASSGVPGAVKVAWDTSGQWRSRVKLAIEKYGSNPAALKQIYAAETETVVKHIKAGLKK